MFFHLSSEVVPHSNAGIRQHRKPKYKKNVRLRQRILIDGFWRGSLVFLIQTWNDKSYVWLDPNMVMEGK